MESAEPPPAATETSPVKTNPVSVPSSETAALQPTTVSAAPNLPQQQQKASLPPSSQHQTLPPLSSSIPSEPVIPVAPAPAISPPLPSLQPPVNPPSQPQPQVQSQSQLQPQLQTQTQPQPQTLAAHQTVVPQPHPQLLQQQQTFSQQPHQRPPQPGRAIRSPQFPPHVASPASAAAATASSSSSPLPLPSSSVASSSGPLQRPGMAIGVPATLHHQRTQQQSPVPFSSFGPSPAFNQTFNGLPRSSVGMPNQGSNTNTQVRHPVQTIQNPGVGAQGTTMRPGGVTGNHQQRPAQPSLRSVSPSNIQSSTNHKFQPGSFRGPSVSSPSSPSPSQSQSSQPHQQPWMTAQGRPANPGSLSSPSFRAQSRPQLSQQRPHQPQQPSMPTSLHQQQISGSQQQQNQKQLLQQQQQQQSQQQQQQQTPLIQLQQQQQALQPPQSLPKAQQAVHQQQQLSRSAGQKSLVPASMQSGATQPGSFPPTSGTDDGESSNHILSKRSIRDLVAQIDPSERLDPEVEDILVEVAEDFVESITTFGCSLAKHRKSTTLEAKDILLHLERNWNMTIPGFGGDEIKCYKKPLTNDVHKERLSLIKKSMAGAPEPGNAKSSAAGQSSGGHTKSHAPKAPLIGSPKLA